MRLVSVSALLLAVTCGPVDAKLRIAGLPSPVAAYASELQRECEKGGEGDLAASDDFGLAAISSFDFNNDGAKDYFVYRCFFGCTRNPSFFLGRGSPCGWGELLLSGAGGPQRIFVPGMLNRVLNVSTAEIVVTRPRGLRLIGNYCSLGFADHDPQYVYKLKQGRFQIVGHCGDLNCREENDGAASVLPHLD